MREVTVTLDKPYVLAFGTKALRRLEEATGCPVYAIAEQQLGVSWLVDALWSGLVYNHPDLTIDDVDAIIDTYLENGGDIGPVIEAIVEAMSASGWFARPRTEETASASRTGSSKPRARQD